LADVAFTLQNGRRAFEHRRAVLARDPDEAVVALEALDPERTAAGRAARRGAPVAFLLPGQGAQEPGMAAGLYRDEPLFRAELDRAAAPFQPHLGFDLREVLVSADPGRLPPRAADLSRTEIAQPALFAVEHALARTWMAWGVVPKALLGHSLGEYVAACLAGVLSLDDAAALVAARGRLLQRLPPGAMLAVPLPPEEVEPLLGGGLAVAAVNAPARTVVSGPPEAIADLEELLAGRGVTGRRLATSHAFHSPMMEPVLPLFAAEVRKARLSPPALPYLSNLTGTWIKPEEATDPDYWVRHLRETVRFASGLAELLADPNLVLLEAGPGRALAGAARQVLPGVPARQGGTLVALPSLPSTPDAPEGAFALLTLGRLWAAGVEIDWPALHAGTRRARVPLPTYPFERRRFWIDLPRESEQRPVQPAGASFAEPAAPIEPGGPLPAEPVVLRQLAGIWRDLLHVDEVGPGSDFFALGGDSLLAIGLASRLREDFGIEIPVRELLVRPRLAQLAAAVDEALARRPGALPHTLVTLQEGRPGRLPFFAVHPSGGNVVCYRPLVGRLDPDRPLYALQAPGLEGEQEPFLHVADLAAHHVATVRQAQPAGPYVIGGWSSGGMVAFEMARQLEQQGDHTVVVLFDTIVPAEGEAMDDLDLLLWKARALGVPLTAEDLNGHDGFRLRLSALLARAGEGLPPAEAAAQRRLLAAELSSLAGFFRYRPQPLATGALVAFRATGHRDPDGVSREIPFATVDVVTTWRRLTAGPFTVHEVAADHANLLQEPWVGEVAALLDRHLEELEAPVAEVAGGLLS
jgi:thioesterase domain-containing protein/acyl carrier protein